MPRRYRVEITDSAKQDVASTYDLIAQDKPKAAAKWLRAFDRHVRALRRLPLLHEVIPEVEDLEQSYRHVIWGNYRIIYKVEGSLITVARLFHAARILKPRHLEE